MTETLTSTYHQGTLTAEQLQTEIDYALTEILAEDGTVLGISQDDTASVRIKVEGEGGFDPGTVLLTIALWVVAGMTEEAGSILLKKVLGKVRKRCGDDALGDP